MNLWYMMLVLSVGGICSGNYRVMGWSVWLGLIAAYEIALGWGIL